MPIRLRAVPAALAGVLLLAACGSEQASPQSTTGPATCGPSTGPSPAPDPSPEDGVKVVALDTCGSQASAEIEVTNRSTQAAAFTVTLGFVSELGGDTVEHVVASVGPGRTVWSAVDLGAWSQVSDLKVLKVRSVPAAEAPSASGPCPASGVHVYADQGDAAMGLRVVGLHLVNCGSTPYELNGYPEIELLDEAHDSVKGVRILKGTEQISTGLGGEGGPRPVVLEPGEGAAATLAWRNTTQFGEAVNVPYVRLVPKSGARPVIVTPELDLGTTGRLGVGAWRKDDSGVQSSGRP
ncbi:DUF4232 domain-containing protein [Streptomyces sp. NPDC096205]|uniref:DUF4232 domain-containing protein n=1 Tax=Streptomyces sp. NPDC096205 TaxID=3366081 RepID=UPI0037F60812